MLAFMQLSPIMFVIGLILAFRRPPVHAAAGGAALALLLWFGGAATPFASPTLNAVLEDTLILFASTAAVIAPGLLFVILIERTGANRSLAQWMTNFGWPLSGQILFVVLGFAPMLESMTGFGVSMVATIPMLLTIVGRQTALRLALTGMCIMPWGTLGLATVIGATLAHLGAPQLGGETALTSAAVFVCAALIALYLSGERSVSVYGLAMTAGLVFALLLRAFSLTLGPEIAGVLAGASVAVAAMTWAHLRLNASASFPMAAWPYGVLLAAVLTLKALNLYGGMDLLWVLKGQQVSWKPLSSPGIALMMVNVLLVAKLGMNGLSEAFLARAKRPLLTILFFLLMSQILLKAGFLESVRSALAQLDPTSLAPLVAVLGSLSGYVTGSNVGGNAIVMPSLAIIDVDAVTRTTLAAIQNSAAGHAALGSLPIVALVASIAKADKTAEQDLIRFALGLVLLNTLLVAVAGYALMSFH
ncbi:MULTISPECIES: transporter [unclassified Pseudomonas]|uniref:transporter n=1 Tax=unclassified Pseudomonas TaxID=196821 RepID=UPI0025DBEE07|nr:MULTISPECIES: transporter [unclassified Pseudomonas]